MGQEHCTIHDRGNIVKIPVSFKAKAGRVSAPGFQRLVVCQAWFTGDKSSLDPLRRSSKDLDAEAVRPHPVMRLPRDLE